MSIIVRAGAGVVRLAGRVHYAWVIAGVLALVQVLGNSIGMAAGVLVAPLNDPQGGFGWSIGTIGAALMAYYLVGAAVAPVVGWLGDRYGARRMMLIGALMYAGSLLLLGMVREPWHFFLTFGVMLSITQSICMVPLLAAVSDWFKHRLGLAVGLVWAAGGLGTAAVAPGATYLIGEIGWQWTFWIVGVVGGSILFVLTAMFRNRPADIGMRSYGSTGDEPEASSTSAVAKLRAKVFNQHLRRTSVFWNLPLIHGLGCGGHGIILIYAMPIAIQQGIGPVAASVILSLISVFSVISRFLTPILTERVGGKPTMGLALLVQGVTVIALFWAQDVWMFYLFAILFGVGFGGEMSAYLVVNRQYFGSGPMATCYGFQMMGALIGHAIATGLGGLIIYVTGSYSVVLGLSVGFSLVGVLVVLNLEPSGRVLIPDWEDSLPAEARSVVASAVGD